MLHDWATCHVAVYTLQKTVLQGFSVTREYHIRPPMYGHLTALGLEHLAPTRRIYVYPILGHIEL